MGVESKETQKHKAVIFIPILSNILRLFLISHHFGEMRNCLGVYLGVVVDGWIPSILERAVIATIIMTKVSLLVMHFCSFASGKKDCLAAIDLIDLWLAKYTT